MSWPSVSALSLAFPFHWYTLVAEKGKNLVYSFRFCRYHNRIMVTYLRKGILASSIISMDGIPCFQNINSSKHFNSYVRLIESQNSPVVLSRSLSRFTRYSVVRVGNHFASWATQYFATSIYSLKFLPDFPEFFGRKSPPPPGFNSRLQEKPLKFKGRM